MQKKSLKEISEIIAGYTFREALRGDPKGKTTVLLAKNINQDGSVNYEDMVRVNLSLLRTNAYVSKNDVLLSSRGIFRAGVFAKKEESTLAASSLFILRIKDENIIPEYLSVYLNSEECQNDIRKSLTGSTIKTILRGALENLSIPIPSMIVQKMIIDISKNWNKREKLLNQKINLSKSIAEGAIKQLLTT